MWQSCIRKQTAAAVLLFFPGHQHAAITPLSPRSTKTTLCKWGHWLLKTRPLWATPQVRILNTEQPAHHQANIAPAPALHQPNMEVLLQHSCHPHALNQGHSLSAVYQCLKCCACVLQHGYDCFKVLVDGGLGLGFLALIIFYRF